MNIDILDMYDKSTECSYRGEEYSVRDNGAVLRRAREGKRLRPLDDKWTFGNPCKSKGYMTISNHTVHRIVAVAFHGEPPTKNHIVDHIDTNRRNNRRENLRWITKLENILLNPISAKRVIQLYGSIEEFLEYPSKPKNGALEPSFDWMRTVTEAEAEYSRERLSEWAASDKAPSGGTLGEWVFSRGEDKVEEPAALVQSLSKGSAQRNWRHPVRFPLAEEIIGPNSLETYITRLVKGAIFVRGEYGSSTIEDVVVAKNRAAVFVVARLENGPMGNIGLAKITFEYGLLVHEHIRLYVFHEWAIEDAEHLASTFK